MRIENKALLFSYYVMPCVVCGNTHDTVGHHEKSKGSGGDDIPENVMALCHTHHMERHQFGQVFMANKYTEFKMWLDSNGWVFCAFNKKYIRHTREGTDD